MSDERFKKLAELASQLPKGLGSDWEDTNHFEMTCDDAEYFWLDRIGLLMDIAEEVGRLRDEGLLY